MRAMLSLILAGLMISAVSISSAQSAGPDGLWSGMLSCSENTINRGPSFTQPIELQIANGLARAQVATAATLETFELRTDGDGKLSMSSKGEWRNDSSRRWTTRLSGGQTGDDIILIGKMYGGDGATLVRERCELALRRDRSPAGAPTLAEAPAPAEAPRHTSDARDRSPPLARQEDHRSLTVRYVAKAPRRTGSTSETSSGLQVNDDRAVLPESWLYGPGQDWHFRSTARLGAPPVPIRQATSTEGDVLKETRELISNHLIKAIALIDGGRIVDVVATPEVRLETRLMSASMAKTFTGVAAGQAICAGKLTLNTRADALIPALAGKPLGAATLRDVLLMASGTTDPPAKDVLGTTVEETRYHLEGPGNLESLLSSPSQSSAQRGVFSSLRPGEKFSYKARDPYVVALMIERSVGMPAVRWIESQLLPAIGTEHPVVLATDRSGYFHGSNGSVRMALIDWIRFAIFVDAERRRDTCLGKFLRELATTQIRAPIQDGVNGYFNGYGYLTWTENTLAPKTFWAVGYGGQRIGWSTDTANSRVFLMFSTSSDREMNRIYPVAGRWINR